MELKEYKELLIEECSASSEVNGNSPEQEFINYAITLFEENQEVFDMKQCYFEMQGPRNRKILIDGYSYDEADNAFVLFCSKFDVANELASITNTEIQQYIKYMEAFIDNSHDGYIRENSEFSCEGNGVANDLERLIKNHEITKFKFYIITNCLLSERVKTVTHEKIQNIDVDINVWDIETLYNSDKNNREKEDISINICEYLEEGLPCIKAFEDVQSEYTAYLAVIPGVLLADLYGKYGSKLLEGNVRSFLSSNGKVNMGIKGTIENSPSFFFTYNNGIATTAKSVELADNKIVQITNLQIINGAQTTASIYFTKFNDRNNKIDLSKIFVPMKLTVVNSENYSQIVEKISRYSNTQNKVSDADFFSNSSFHTSFKEYSDKIFAPAINSNQYQTRWFYERARGSYKQEQMKMTKAEKAKFEMRNPKTQVISKTDLAKFYNCYLTKPHIVSKGAQFNMRNFAEYYEKNLKKEINEYFFKKCISLAIIFKETDRLVSQQEWFFTGAGYKANVVAYTVSKLFEEINTKFDGKKSLDFDLVWNKQTMFKELKNFISVLSKKAYEHITSLDREMQNISEWAKREECWKRFKEVPVTMPTDFIDLLLNNDEEKDKIKKARKEKAFDSDVEAQIYVVRLGSEYWLKLSAIAKQQFSINVIENGDLDIIINMERTGRIPNSFQSQRLMAFQKKCSDHGIDVENLIKTEE